MQKKYFTWKISKSEEGIKLLDFLKKQLNASNREVKKALDKGLCLVNGKIERFATVILKKNSEIKLNVLWKKLTETQSEVSIKILYEDQYFVAIDKPINFISSDENIHLVFPKNYTLIHRLDKETSGILLIAKDQKFKDLMVELFKEKKIIKKYLALVDGSISQKEKKIEGFINKIKSFDGQTLYGPSKDGKYALTYLKVLEEFNNKTLVELEPVTGRTHQLRVHMKQISHPILGDFLYSKKFKDNSLVTRLMLHCFYIEFIHPVTHEEISISCDAPQEFFS